MVLEEENLLEMYSAGSRYVTSRWIFWAMLWHSILESLSFTQVNLLVYKNKAHTAI